MRRLGKESTLLRSTGTGMRPVTRSPPPRYTNSWFPGRNDSSRTAYGKRVVTVRNVFYYCAGLAFLALARTKNALRGYSTPKPFDLRDADRAVRYDFQVVDDWLSHLGRYERQEPSLVGKNVLELGPGSDHGIGLLL